MILLIFAAVLAFMVMHALTVMAPLDWRVEGHWRPILCPGRRLDDLHSLEWSAHRYQQQAERLVATGDHRAAQLYSDLAHIRALEERLEAERFTQRATSQQQPRVRAIARVLA